MNTDSGLSNKVHDLFSQTWLYYQKILESDYMHHRRFSDATAKALRTIQMQRPISLLDIGCGDASPILSILKSTAIDQYTGYDISERVLDLCAANLSSFQFNKKFCCGNMEQLLNQEEAQFDVIYSSYAIHHLQDEEKQLFIKRISESLKSGGSFIYIDIDRKEDQSIEDYRKAYSDAIMNDWNELEMEGKTHVVAHLNQFDFPAIQSDIMDWADAAGLKPINLACELRHLFVHFQKD